MRSSRLSRDWQKNCQAGFTVALVNLPLSVSLAIAANATPVMGVITAVWAGLTAAICGGSMYNVMGPTGALSGVLAMYAITYGADMLPVLALLSGATIGVFYLLKLEKYIVFIPSCVVHGFTLGISSIIALNQLPFAFGLQDLPKHEHLLGNVTETLLHAGNATPAALLLSSLTLLMLFAFLRFAPHVPGIIVVSILGMGLGYATHEQWISLNVSTLLNTFGKLELQLWQLPAWKLPALDGRLLQGVFTVSVVAILETLLSGRIADTLAKTEHKFNQRREVLGLALANMASGLAGGLPATAALARTALNVKSGANTKLAIITNPLFVIAIAALFFSGFSYLPLPVVAGILLYVSMRMVEVRHFKELWHMDKIMLAVALLVAVITVTIDPIVGILLGSTVALLFFVHQLSRGQSELTLHSHGRLPTRLSPEKMRETDVACDVTVYRFAGELTYFNAESHQRNIKRIRRSRHLVLGLRNLFYVDPDGLAALRGIIEECEKRDMQVVLTGLSEYISPMLERSPWFRERERKHLVYGSTTEALTALGFPVSAKD